MSKRLSLYPPKKLGLSPSEAERWATNERKRLLKERRKKEKRK